MRPIPSSLRIRLKPPSKASYFALAAAVIPASPRTVGVDVAGGEALDSGLSQFIGDVKARFAKTGEEDRFAVFGDAVFPS